MASKSKAPPRPPSLRSLLPVFFSLFFPLLLFPMDSLSQGFTPELHCNVPLVMSDGITLYAHIERPAEEGEYPTILTVFGYNKDSGKLPGRCDGIGGGLVEKGYAVMVIDDRGTGASEGSWDAWGARTQEDYAEILDWIQIQPWSNGKVGVTGASYMGITSFLVAEKDAERVEDGKERAVLAVWADVPMADAYRDVVCHGGNVDTGFMPFWLGLTSVLSMLPPSTLASDPDAPQAWLDHLLNAYDFAGKMLLSAAAGGEHAYDGPFFRIRSPGERASLIQVPVAWTGGWFDIFQRGEALFFEILENSPCKKFWMMPIYHVSAAPEIWNQQGIGGIEEVKLAWWDRWLKGKENHIEDLPSVNLWTMGSNRWRHEEKWPLPRTKYTRFYFHDDSGGSSPSLLNHGGLALEPPGYPGFDRMPVLPAGGVFNRSTVQWTAGLLSGFPFEEDNRLAEVPGLTYTTDPLAEDTEVTGLITAEIWAELTCRDATFVVTLSDVAPDGVSTQITAGWLNASLRALDDEKTTRGPGNLVIRPYHPFTVESREPVVPNIPERYLVEVFPTSHVFLKNHRIRVTVTTADIPHMITPLNRLLQMVGQAKVLRSPAYPSHILLPLLPAGPGSQSPRLANEILPDRYEIIGTCGNSFLARFPGGQESQNGSGKRLLYLEGDAYARGYAVGALCPMEVYRMTHDYMDEIVFELLKLPLSGKDLPVLWPAVKQLLSRAACANQSAVPEEFLSEMRGMAQGCQDRGVRVTFEDLLTINCGFDALESLYMNFGGIFMCNEFGVFNDATADGRLYHGRDFMFPTGGDSFADASMVLVHKPTRGHPFVAAAVPGFVGIPTGLNARGVSCGMDVVNSMFSRPAITGMGTLLLCRNVVQFADSRQEGIRLIREADRAVPWLYLVADGKEPNATVLETEASTLLPPGDALLGNLVNLIPGLGHIFEGSGQLFPANVVDGAGGLLTAGGSLIEGTLTSLPLLSDLRPGGGMMTRAADYLDPDGLDMLGFQYMPPQASAPMYQRFPKQQEDHADLVAMTNHYIIPQMVASNPSAFYGSYYSDSSGPRYDQFIGLIKEYHGKIDRLTAMWLIDFLNPAVNPWFYGGDTTQSVKGHHVLMDNQSLEMWSLHGYYDEPWVHVDLKDFLD